MERSTASWHSLPAIDTLRNSKGFSPGSASPGHLAGHCPCRGRCISFATESPLLGTVRGFPWEGVFCSHENSRCLHISTTLRSQAHRLLPDVLFVPVGLSQEAFSPHRTTETNRSTSHHRRRLDFAPYKREPTPSSNLRCFQTRTLLGVRWNLPYHFLRNGPFQGHQQFLTLKLFCFFYNASQPILWARHSSI